MRLVPWDPDVETIVSRIERRELDLQPDFQRGEVWSKAKRQRLIDSILREWHIPPIHVIVIKDTQKQEVLDGQQRLAAIRDFVRGEFPVDGQIEPIEPEIRKLSGMRFHALPDEWKRRFFQFTLRVIRIVDYSSEEPGELFFRLNQPTSLTAAEQRNAFFGPVREQIKGLASQLESSSIDDSVLGFSNSRMAYDDLLARVCLTVKRGTLAEKVTASDLVSLYRSEIPLPSDTEKKVRAAIERIGQARPIVSGQALFNKATAYTWFLFVIRANDVASSEFSHITLGHFMLWYEKMRQSLEETPATQRGATILANLFPIYGDRSASRVADVSSVMLRDAIVWLAFEVFLRERTEYQFPITKAQVDRIHTAYDMTGSPFGDDAFARHLIESGWGAL